MKALYRNQRGWLAPMSARRASKLALQVVRRHEQALARRPRADVIADLRRAPHAPSLSVVLDLLVELRELFDQQLGLRAHPVQIQAVLLLLSGFACQLRTGEGKSLAAAMAAAVAGCGGRRVSIYTVNDYLAARDQNEFSNCFLALGLSSEVLLESQSETERLPLFAANVLYMAPRVAIFDRIRQQVRQEKEQANRPLWADDPPATPLDNALRDMAIVDEIDALLIDEATVPFVLSEQIPLDAEHLALYEEIVVLLSDVAVHEVMGDGRQQRLVSHIRARLEAQLHERYESRFSRSVLMHALDLGVSAFWNFLLNRDYVVVDGQIQVIDLYTGRPSPDRRWEQGLHQIIEIKEGVAPTAGSRTQAMLSYPEFFATFRYLGGMSGTLQGVRGELRKIYRVGSRVLPTHRPVALSKQPLRVARDADEQLQWLILYVQSVQQAGRAMLIGAGSVARSLEVSAQLGQNQITHRLLNAKTVAEEAAIIAAAGQTGAVTVATAMAGRGTDIKLSPSVKAAGGLEVILLDRHDLARNDHQFFGRAGRQGDPGVVGSLLSLDDPLLDAHSGGGGVGPSSAGLPLVSDSDRTSQQTRDQRGIMTLLITALPSAWRPSGTHMIMAWRQWQMARHRRKQREYIKKEQKRLKSLYAVSRYRR